MEGTEEEKVYCQIFKEFKKTRQDLNECIDIMRKWALTQPHFPEEPSYRILRFVILYNKFSIEKAKQKLDMYYTIRGILPELFSYNPFSPEMQSQHKIWQVVPLPKPADNNIRIIYHRLNPDYDDPKYFDQNKEYAYFFNVIELIILEDPCYRVHYIVDLKGSKMGHVLKINPMTMKKVAVVLEKVYSNNLSSLYLVNFLPFYETFLNTVLKPLLNPKIRDRIKVSSGTDILLEDFGKERMPADIGGEENSLEELKNDLVMKRFEKHRDRFEKLATLKVNENLRPDKLENDDLLGFYGNFKKIAVD